jgi:hypothetical protein
MAYDSSSARLRYAYTGVGYRYFPFFSGTGYAVTEGANRIVMTPKWRFYLGGDGGISHAVILATGPVLDV